MSTTVEILNQTFGKPSGEMEERTKAFAYVTSGFPIYAGMSNEELQLDYLKKLDRQEALLNGFIEQLEILAPPAIAKTSTGYRLHPEIETVSGDLLRDEHYKQAALEAYIRVIDEVRQRSGLDADGEPLMNRAFGCTKQEPVIRFNELSTAAHHDEQTGFMNLFKGIVRLRHSKAHSNRLFNDASRGFEYLALASLLMRILEIAEINRTD